MDQPKTLTVPEAGRVYFDLGRNASYEAARRGDIPTIRIGRLLRVPVVQFKRKLRGVDPTKPDQADHDPATYRYVQRLGAS